MTTFFITLTTVAMMLVYCVPGYILIKGKYIKEDTISAFARVLLCVCSPCLQVYSMTRVEPSASLFLKMALFFIIITAIEAVMLFGGFAVLRKRGENEARMRVANVAVGFGNCAFIGVPLLEAVFPDNPEAIVYSAVYSLSMNMLGWTVASALITRDKKYISPKKVLLNPATIAFIAVLPILIFNVRIPGQIDGMIALMGRMSTPLCMLIIGMRLATSSLKNVFTSPFQYAVVAVKQFVMPLVAFFALAALPLDPVFKQTMCILCCSPVASVVLNFTELLGQGQKTAANLVLLGTLLSVITIPIMSFIVV